MIVGINHITVDVKNKSDAEHFYFDQLGLEKVMVGRSLWAKVGHQFIHINENTNYLPQNTFHHFAIEVDNLNVFLKELINKGVQIFDLDKNVKKIDINSNLEKENRNYFTKDPSGNIIEFIDSQNLFFKNKL